jgi:hypothetical protein
MLTPDVCRVLTGNLRTMCDEIDELLALPTQEQAGLVRNQLEYVGQKLDLAVSMAAHGAGMVEAPAPEAPPVPAMPSLSEIHKGLMAQLHPGGSPPVAKPYRRTAPVRKRKVA